jgi:hypothetical protein
MSFILDVEPYSGKHRRDLDAFVEELSGSEALQKLKHLRAVLPVNHFAIPEHHSVIFDLLESPPASLQPLNRYALHGVAVRHTVFTKNKPALRGLCVHG